MTKENLVRTIVLTIKSGFNFLEENWQDKIDLWKRDGMNVDFTTSGMISEKGTMSTLCLILEESELSPEESKIVTEALTEIHAKIEQLEKLTEEIERGEISDIHRIFQIRSPKKFLQKMANDLKEK